MTLSTRKVPYTREMTPAPLATIDGYGQRCHLSCIEKLLNASAAAADVVDAELN